MESQGLVFNSVVFLFCFLPVALLLYYIVPGRAKNAVLLLESIFFYCWGGVRYLPLILILVAVNYIAGLLLGKAKGRAARLALLILPVAVSAAALVFFKYTNFLIETFNQIASAQLSTLSFLDVLPLGISYYVFKLISYIADVHTGRTEPERDPIAFAAYVMLFPQLMLGPIVKYRDLAPALHNVKNRCSAAQIEAGAEMFVFGLAKKVILADSIGALWSDLLAADVGLANVSTPLAWLGILAYSFQLYFDFAGYSEMSNGLSRMMGFDCPANFDLPYISASITEFWRRWHISLSSWFRDYIYIPLGGNRRGLPRQLFNMLVVWALTGIWHGANWNFICWGLYYFVLLAAEKLFLLKHLQKGRVWPHLYTLFFVVVGWAMFVGNDPGVQFGLLFQKLFTPSAGVSALYFLRNYGVLLAVSFVCCTPLIEKIWDVLRRRSWSRVLTVGALLVVSTAYVVGSTNSPFLYFNF